MANKIAPELDFVDDRLPAVFRTQQHTLMPSGSDYQKFLEADLSVERIESILSHLWLAGRPYPPRALNIQRVLKRDIVATTDASLHLVWASQKIYIKPLPRYITTKAFYENRLSLPHPYGPALGLLFTYLALVPTELDFALARELHLFPENYEWSSWKQLTRRVLDDYPNDSIYVHLPKRYIHGELRLSRLDKIYRYLRGDLLHGYSPLMGNTRYVDFFSGNLTTITAATAYIVVVLTAMQVGLATNALVDNDTFQSASYGFTVFAIIAPLIAVGVVVAIFVFMLLANWSRTVKSQRRRFEKLGVKSLSERRSSREGEIPEVMA